MIRALKWFAAGVLVLTLSLTMATWLNRESLAMLSHVTKERNVLLSAGLREKRRADSLERLVKANLEPVGGSRK